SGAIENEKNIERLKQHCLFVYVRSFPQWISNKNHQFLCKSKEEEGLYKLNGATIVQRDNILCKVSDIVSYGDYKEYDTFVNDIVEKIKEYYGV
ncbi:MAG: hypothetical protein J6J23_05880, partial [Clostridia bacterium]|nr:hypothetical protein [Clostridia bacterium]